jgi:hypothetical protein
LLKPFFSIDYFLIFAPNAPKSAPPKKRPLVKTRGLLWVEVSGGLQIALSIFIDSY